MINNLSLKKRLTLLLLSGLTATATFISSCMKDTGPAPQVAALSVANASPTAPAFNFYLDDQQVNKGSLSFKYALNYFQAYIGNRKATIKNASTNAVLKTATIPLLLDKYYSLFVTGKDSVEFLVTTDSLYDPAAGKALVRFLNLSPDAGPLQLVTSGTSSPFDALYYKGHTGYIQIDAGTYNLVLKDQATGEDKATLPNTTFQENKLYTLYARGLINTTVDSLKIGIHKMQYN